MTDLTLMISSVFIEASDAFSSDWNSIDTQIRLFVNVQRGIELSMSLHFLTLFRMIRSQKNRWMLAALMKLEASNTS